jgi:hypothetical protein
VCVCVCVCVCDPLPPCQAVQGRKHGVPTGHVQVCNRQCHRDRRRPSIAPLGEMLSAMHGANRARRGPGSTGGELEGDPSRQEGGDEEGSGGGSSVDAKEAPKEEPPPPQGPPGIPDRRGPGKKPAAGRGSGSEDSDEGAGVALSWAIDTAGVVG